LYFTSTKKGEKIIKNKAFFPPPHVSNVSLAPFTGSHFIHDGGGRPGLGRKRPRVCAAWLAQCREQHPCGCGSSQRSPACSADLNVGQHLQTPFRKDRPGAAGGCHTAAFERDFALLISQQPQRGRREAAACPFGPRVGRASPLRQRTAGRLRAAEPPAWPPRTETLLVRRGPGLRVVSVQIFVVQNTPRTDKHFRERLAPQRDAELLETLKCQNGIKLKVVGVLKCFLGPGEITIKSVMQPQPRRDREPVVSGTHVLKYCL